MLPSCTDNTAGNRNSRDRHDADPSDSMIVVESPRRHTASSRRQMLERAQKGGPPDQETKSTESETYSNLGLEVEDYSTNSRLSVLDDTGDNTGATLSTRKRSERRPSSRSLDSIAEYLERSGVSQQDVKQELGLSGHEEGRHALPGSSHSGRVSSSPKSSRFRRSKFRRSKTLPDLKHMMRQIILPQKKESKDTGQIISKAAYSDDSGHRPHGRVKRRGSDSALPFNSSKRPGAITSSAAFSPGLLKTIRQKARLKRSSNTANSALHASAALLKRADLSELEVPINTGVVTSPRGFRRPLKSFSNPDTLRKAKRTEELVQALSSIGTSQDEKLSSNIAPPFEEQKNSKHTRKSSTSSHSPKRGNASPKGTPRATTETEEYRWEAHLSRSSEVILSESRRGSLPATASLPIKNVSKEHRRTSSLNETKTSYKVASKPNKFKPISRSSSDVSEEPSRWSKDASTDASSKSPQSKQKSTSRQQKPKTTKQSGQGFKDDISERSLSMEEIMDEELSNKHELVKEQKKKRKKTSEKKSKRSPRAKDNINVQTETVKLPALIDFHHADYTAKSGTSATELPSPDSGNSDKTPSPETDRGLKKEAKPRMPKSSSFPDLEAIVKQDAPRLRSEDIFFDSPESSPLSDLSLPSWRFSRPDDSVVERLSSSMPNLDTAHWSSSDDDIPDLSEGTDRKNSRSSHFTSEDVFFFDESDDCSNPKTLLAEHERKSAKTEDVGRHERVRDIVKQAETQTRGSSDFHVARAGILEQFKSHARVQAAIHSSGSPSGARALARGFPASDPPPPEARPSNEAKLDRGPRKPQRRSDSFEESETAVNDQSAVPAHAQQELDNTSSDSLGASQEESFKIPATSMAFRRTKNRRWIQTTPEKVVVKRPSDSSSVEIGAMYSSTSQLERQRDNTRSDSVLTSELRRSSSVGDLVEGGTGAASVGRRWDSGDVSKSTEPPKFSRQLRSEGQEVAASVSMDRMELGKLLSLPRAKAKKNNSLERSYLPVRLQGATKKSDRAKSQSVVARQDDESRAVAKPRAEDSAGPSDGYPGQSSITVGTGLHDMFDITGELEEDLAKFENQIAFLREQRSRRAEAEREEDRAQSD